MLANILYEINNGQQLIKSADFDILPPVGAYMVARLPGGEVAGCTVTAVTWDITPDNPPVAVQIIIKKVAR